MSAVWCVSCVAVASSTLVNLSLNLMLLVMELCASAEWSPHWPKRALTHFLLFLTRCGGVTVDPLRRHPGTFSFVSPARCPLSFASSPRPTLHIFQLSGRTHSTVCCLWHSPNCRSPAASVSLAENWMVNCLFALPLVLGQCCLSKHLALSSHVLLFGSPSALWGGCLRHIGFHFRPPQASSDPCRTFRTRPAHLVSVLSDARFFWDHHRVVSPTHCFSQCPSPFREQVWLSSFGQQA